MRIAVLPGDGIGPEITDATVAVLEALDRKHGLGLAFERHVIGWESFKANGTTLPESVVEAVRGADGFILGPVSTQDYPPKAEGGINPSGYFRIALDLWANIRPARSREGLSHYGRTPMDLVIVRENTEGFYADRNMFQGIGEFMPTEDIALSVRKITRRACERIARAAFELARTRRKHVTAVHKSNVLHVTEGLFLEECRKIAKQHPDVTYEEQLVDSMAALLVRQADHYDVVVTTNMYGDILSDEASELSGSIGLAASINASDDHCMAQAQHGSAPDIARQGIANPTSLALSAGMLLGWLGRRHEDARYVRAEQTLEMVVTALLIDPATRTKDLGGPLGTTAFTTAICERIARA